MRIVGRENGELAGRTNSVGRENQRSAKELRDEAVLVTIVRVRARCRERVTFVCSGVVGVWR